MFLIGGNESSCRLMASTVGEYWKKLAGVDDPGVVLATDVFPLLDFAFFMSSVDSSLSDIFALAAAFLAPSLRFPHDVLISDVRTSFVVSESTHRRGRPDTLGGRLINCLQEPVAVAPVSLMEKSLAIAQLQHPHPNFRKRSVLVKKPLSERDVLWLKDAGTSVREDEPQPRGVERYISCRMRRIVLVSIDLDEETGFRSALDSVVSLFTASADLFLPSSAALDLLCTHVVAFVPASIVLRGAITHLKTYFHRGQIAFFTVEDGLHVLEGGATAHGAGEDDNGPLTMKRIAAHELRVRANNKSKQPLFRRVVSRFWEWLEKYGAEYDVVALLSANSPASSREMSREVLLSRRLSDFAEDGRLRDAIDVELWDTGARNVSFAVQGTYPCVAKAIKDCISGEVECSEKYILGNLSGSFLHD
jgi:hypothetical protein